MHGVRVRGLYVPVSFLISGLIPEQLFLWFLFTSELSVDKVLIYAVLDVC